MKAIGGYFELECGHNPLYHPDGIYLNVCRSGIRYLIRTFGIKRIHVPFFTCNVVFDTIQQEGCEVVKYHLDHDLMPATVFPKDDFILYNNYFGVLGKNVEALHRLYPNLIADNAQAFFSKSQTFAAIYSPRKFFGLPDGGILRGNNIPPMQLTQGHSIQVSSHLLQRIDYDARTGYSDFVKNDKSLNQYSLERASSLTVALMGNIDYNSVIQKRWENFHYLHERLHSRFPFSFAEDDVPMVYPFFMEKGAEMRNQLIQNQVFVATYWPNVLLETEQKDIEYKMTTDILPLPIDQRYGQKEMDKIIQIICK